MTRLPVTQVDSTVLPVLFFPDVEYVRKVRILLE